MFFVLFQISRCLSPYLIDELGSKFNLDYTDFGYTPHGQNITGILQIVDDLCQQQSDGIILASFSTSCNRTQQLFNTQHAQAVILLTSPDAALDLPNYHLLSSTYVTIPFRKGLKLKQAMIQNVTLIFPINKQQVPKVTYFIYSLEQSTGSLEQIIEYDIDFTPTYFLQAIPCDTSPSEFCTKHFGPYNIIEWSLVLVLELKLFNKYGKDIWFRYRLRFVNECNIFPSFEEIYQCAIVLMSQEQIEIDFNEQESVPQLAEQIRSYCENIRFHQYSQGLFMINGLYVYTDYLETRNINGLQQSIIVNALCQSYNNPPVTCLPVSNEHIRRQHSALLINFLIGLFLIFVIIILYILRRCFKMRQIGKIQQQFIVQENGR